MKKVEDVGEVARLNFQGVITPEWYRIIKKRTLVVLRFAYVTYYLPCSTHTKFIASAVTEPMVLKPTFS